MEKLFDSLRLLDARAEIAFHMKDGLLMEHAACGMAAFIYRYTEKKLSKNKAAPTVQIVCGIGNNGGDGLALARLLADWCTVIPVMITKPQSPLCIMQAERLKALKLPLSKKLVPHCDILVDAVLGTGLHRPLDETIHKLITAMNAIEAYKVACDIPSGLDAHGVPSPIAFKANLTLSMGALKTALYADTAKDYTGIIRVINLGIPRRCYEDTATTFLLSHKDMQLPCRTLQNTHKKQYGHALFFCGEKPGACFLAASAALHFGAGLVSLCGNKPDYIPADYLYSEKLSEEFSAFSVGSGLGDKRETVQKAFNCLKHTALQRKPIIFDADILHHPELPALLNQLALPVVTPHPKEFQSLLRNSGIADISIEELQHKRFVYARLFCRTFPHTVLVLKGAYPIIGQREHLYVNPLGTNALAKAGTGDVLSGMITALAAQQYPLLTAAITASLCHAKTSRRFNASYGLTASELANAIGSPQAD
ncbi:MAG: NAD(P)H-hydrate dehydratase [Treponema sp.]